MRHRDTIELGRRSDRVTGFEAGADDYVTKPFSLRELVGRIKVGLRRANGRAPERRQTFGAIEVDLSAHRVSTAGEEVELTPKEFEILALLIRRAGEVITRDEFLDATVRTAPFTSATWHREPSEWSMPEGRHQSA